jgi:hypothetical protein
MIDDRARNTPGARNGLRFAFRALVAVLVVLFISSCGSETYIVGTPVITLQAKPGRFTSYIVTIDEIEMTRKDGTIVELPTVDERIDLAHLSSYANLLEAPAVGIGTYVSATFVLDYSSPYITVGVDGQAFPVPTLLDASTGDLPTTTTVIVKFDPSHPLVITENTSSVVAFDIDLEASNVITSNSSGFVVTVQPFWNVTTQPYYKAPIFARGLYVLANTADNNFIMNVRPLHDVLDNPFGALTVNVNDQTYYNINGVTYVGAAGLAAITQLNNQYADLQIGAYTATPAGGAPFGNLNTYTPSMTAVAVYVGSSLESTIEDQLTGIVEEISGDTVTLMDAQLVDRLGDYGFQQSATVTVSPDTIVSADGIANFTPSLAAISVGQKINVEGQVTVDVSGNPTALDATSETVPGAQVRLQNTPLYGTVNSVTGANLSLNVLAVDFYAPTYLYYTGTGTTAANDANASEYIVNTSAVTGTTPSVGTLVNVNGMVSPFGTADPPTVADFNATSILPVTESQLILEWASGGSDTPFTVVNGAGIIVDLTNAHLLSGTHIVRTGPPTLTTGPTVVNVLNQPNPNLLTIRYAQPTATTPVLFGVGNVTVGEYEYTDPTSYAGEVWIAADGTVPVTKLVATGTYDASTGTFTATQITINVVAPLAT